LRNPAVTLGLAVAVGLAASIFLRTHPPPKVLTASPVVRRVLDDPGSPRVGSAKPDVVIVVFTDYRCPICRATDPALERLVARDPNVQVIFKDWPIFGPASESAARLALAAQDQGRYAQAHRALMAIGWSGRPDQLHALAVRAGLDEQRLRSDLSARGASYASQLRGNALQAWSLGLSGTPAYLVGPYLFERGLDDAQLGRAVTRARRTGWRASGDAD
jgi:protein-disulfide isomerase